MTTSMVGERDAAATRLPIFAIELQAHMTLKFISENAAHLTRAKAGNASRTDTLTT